MSAVRDGRHDFDFLHGTWSSVQRKLTKRLQGSNEWIEFTAESVCFPTLGDLGNADTIHADLPDGGSMDAMSVRIYDVEMGVWRIWWAAAGSPEIFPPVMGSFENGIGHFEGDDLEQGIPVRVAFDWSDITPDSARWSQSFSADGGETWELNWTMDFTRRPD